jgi:DNA-binding NarL/FixJ family response regulator
LRGHDVDGYELLKHVREFHPETPVVLMTAFFYDRDHVIKRSKLAGLDGVLYKKPVDPERLVELVREHCRR